MIRRAPIPVLLPATIALALSGVVLPAMGGSLDVNNAAAIDGGFGLQVELLDNCPFADDVSISGPPTIQGYYAACNNLVVAGVEVDPDASFQAGQSVAFGDGFSVAQGASLFVSTQTPSTPFAYVIDESPASATTMHVSWQSNLDPATIGSGDLFAILTGSSANGAVHFEALLRHDATFSENRLVLRARTDDGSLSDTLGSELVLPAGWNKIEIVWVAGASTGYFVASVNDGAFNGLTLLDNDRARIDELRFGAVSGNADASSGSIYLDAYDSAL